jgi:hypothetical protein
MALMGQYCKAYHVRQLREFPGWQPNLQNLAPEITQVDGQDVERPRTMLTDEDVLFVQESYIVTDGIFLDERIVFDAVTPEWKAFCDGPLAFKVPEDLAPTEATAPIAAQ